MLIQYISSDMIKVFVCGLIVHLVADWIFQNHAMSQKKTNLFHPLAFVHSGVHLVGLLLIFPLWMAIILAIVHLLIDTRVPLQWWRGFFRQTQEGPAALHVAIWGDQTLHILFLAIAAILVG